MSHLTSAQALALKTAINANPTWAAFPMTADGYFDLAVVLNQQATPAFTVWRTNVPRNEVGKTFVASALAAITAGNNDKLANFAAWNESVNPSRADQRQFFDDIFSVTAGASTRAALLILWKRLATHGEKILATGTGSDAAPATMGFEGPLSPDDVFQARNS